MSINAQWSVLKTVYHMRTEMRHLSAHVVNRLMIARKPEYRHPKILSGKNIFKNVTLQILNFIPVSKLIKNFPIWYNVKFSLLFCIV